MPSVLSKLVTSIVSSNAFLRFMSLSTPKKYALYWSIAAVIFTAKYVLYLRKKRKLKKLSENDSKNGKSSHEPFNKKGPAVNSLFYKQMKFLLKIMFPRLMSKQVLILGCHTVALVAKTFLSIYVAQLEGTIVKEIVQRSPSRFLALLGKWILVAIPACMCNSSIRFLERHLSLSLRTQLVEKAYQKYFENQVYYRVGNLDTRIPNVDHSLTDDVTYFANSCARLYSHITKPLLDGTMVSATLLRRANTVGSNMFLGPVITMTVIYFTGEFLKAISPNFGSLVSKEAQYKAHLRHCHSRIVTNSEEIAFYGGAPVEHKILKKAFVTECNQSKRMFFARLWYVFFEQFFLKYGWAATGMIVTAIPILTAAGLKTSQQHQEAARTEYYMQTKNLLLSGGDAIERLMTSYKEVVELAGYCSRVAKMFNVFEDVSKGTYVRESCSTETLSPGMIVENNENIIELKGIKVVTPTGDVILPSLDLKVTPGMHLLITGPNGAGKSSLFRILSGIWPVYGSYMSRPPVSSLFYIPQRPYMSLGNLREQVIYPDTEVDMKRKGLSDDHVMSILEKVRLTHILRQEGGLDSISDWQDVLSGGEKQRMGVARLFYHRPTFALLDECTSAVSIDVEDSLYKLMITSGITLLTITHRPSLFKHHSHVLRFNGDGTWTFKKMDVEKEVAAQH